MGLLQTLHLRRSSPWEPPTLLDHMLTSPLRWLTSLLYTLILSLRGRPFHPPPNTTGDRPPIRVVCLSDTHDQVLRPDTIPDGDLLIHCGDLTVDGSRASIQRQIDWLASLPHRHKVFVCGNHDGWFDPNVRGALGDGEGEGEGEGELDFKGLRYLENSSVTLEFKGGRKLNVYGSGAVPECGGPNFAFQYDRRLHPWKRAIPDETDVLITHTPPAFHLDLSLGCRGLLSEIWRVKPKLHVFGHIHWGAGRQAVYFDECQRAYESLMSRPTTAFGGPLAELFPLLLSPRSSIPAWRDALAVVWYGINSILWKWLMQGPGSNNGGLFVNASVMYGNTGRLGTKVVVLEL